MDLPRISDFTLFSTLFGKGQYVLHQFIFPFSPGYVLLFLGLRNPHPDVLRPLADGN
jgi:hypothetical protein